MFQPPRLLQCNFTVSFPRVVTMRRLANTFEDTLARLAPGQYGQPNVTPVNDQADPKAPRIIFAAAHGLGQIIASQMALALTVNWPGPWQNEPDRCRQFMLERAPLLFTLLQQAEGVHPHFCGMTATMRLTSSRPAGDPAPLHHLAQRLGLAVSPDGLHDVQTKIVRVRDESFFDNITMQNVRSWQLPGPLTDLTRMPTGAAVEQGLDIVGDFNDRYAYNEQLAYYTSPAVAQVIVQRSLASVEEMVAWLAAV